MIQVLSVINGLKTTAEIITAVTTVLGTADSLKDAADPILGEQGKAVVEKTKEKTKSAFGGLMQMASEAKENQVNALNAKKEEKELIKELKQARQLVLQNASQVNTAKDYIKARKGVNIAGSALATGLYGGPGCFVVATYSKMDFDKDLTDYTYLFVGKGAVLGEAIDLTISRDGDPDVYADVKYKQNVHIYSYPCAPTEVDEKYEALVDLFGTEVEDDK